eukprot:2808817-Prymnesium_polylepis.2
MPLDEQEPACRCPPRTCSANLRAESLGESSLGPDPTTMMIGTHGYPPYSSAGRSGVVLSVSVRLRSTHTGCGPVDRPAISRRWRCRTQRLPVVPSVRQLQRTHRPTDR